MKHLFFIVFWLLVTLCFSQEFVQPYEDEIPLSFDCYAVTNQGDSVVGKPVLVIGMARGIRKITLITSEGEKKVFRADELTKLGFKNNGVVNTFSIIERSSSIKKIATTNWKQIFNREYIVFQHTLLPSGKRHVMMQILNPGFDTRIKVFYSNGSRKTFGVRVPLPPSMKIGPMTSNGLRLTGGMQRVYWISKNNDKVYKVKKGRYNKKTFLKIFGDSPEMTDAFNRPYRFKNFPEHVFYYDRLMSAK
jgi:hypothetical protein